MMLATPRSAWRERLRRAIRQRPCGAAGPFEALDVEYHRGVVTPLHSHDWDSLHLVLAGRVTDDYCGAARGAGPGDLLVYHGGAPHRTRVTAGARILHLPLYSAPARMTGGSSPPLFEPRSDLHAQILRIAGALLLGAAASRDELNSAGESLARALQGAPPPRSRDGRLAEAERLLEGTGSRPTLAQLAAACGLSRGHLARLYREAHGCSVGAAVRRRQVVTAARLLLAEPGCPLAEIADRAGFSDQSHLGRVFRGHLGITPRVFRRTLAAARADSC